MGTYHASSTTRPNGSLREGMQTTSAALYLRGHFVGYSEYSQRVLRCDHTGHFEYSHHAAALYLRGGVTSWDTPSTHGGYPYAVHASTRYPKATGRRRAQRDALLRLLRAEEEHRVPHLSTTRAAACVDPP